MTGSRWGRRRILMRDRLRSRLSEELTAFTSALALTSITLVGYFSILLCGGRGCRPDERVHERVALKILQILN
jgi:hypothetical protein